MKISRYLSDDLSGPRCLGLQFNDLAGLIAGVKRVVYASVDNGEDMRRLDEMCAELKLKKLVLGEKRDVSGAPVSDVLIGPRPTDLRRAGKAYSDIMSREWGEALGYPECCVRAYLGWKNKKDRLPRVKDLIFHILDSSPKGTLFPFWMNNVPNYYSRLDMPRSDHRHFARFSELNEGVDRETVIPWHPCSYLCPETLEKGRRIYEVLERYMPATAAFRKQLLSRPVVFNGKFSYVSLDGECLRAAGGFRIAHRGPAGLKTPGSGRLIRVLSGPGELKVSGRGRVRGAAGDRLPPGTVLIPFSAAAET